MEAFTLEIGHEYDGEEIMPGTLPSILGLPHGIQVRFTFAEIYLRSITLQERITG
jgi:hypothetical protein